MRRWLVALWALTVCTPSFAVPLTVVKSSAVVSDPLAEAFPKAIPGAVLDYTVKITNPNSGFASVVVFADAVPANTALYVGDVGVLTGPVIFSDAAVLGVGGSGLTYGYSGLASKTDKIDFSNDGGVSWTYVPAPDANGFDPLVTNIRVNPSGSMNGGSWFSLRFRIRVR